MSFMTLPGGGGGLVPIVSASLSNAASLDFDNSITADYKKYLLVFSAFKPVNDGDALWFRTSTDGTSYDDSASRYGWGRRELFCDTAIVETLSGNEADRQIVLANNVGSGNAEQITGTIWISEAWYNNSPLYDFRGSYESNDAGKVYDFAGSGVHHAAARIKAVQLLFSSGNIDEGEAALYGFEGA